MSYRFVDSLRAGSGRTSRQSDINDKKMFYIIHLNFLHVSLFYVSVNLHSKQTDSGIVYKRTFINAKLRIGKRGKRTELTGRSLLRRRRSALVAITLPLKLLRDYYIFIYFKITKTVKTSRATCGMFLVSYIAWSSFVLICQGRLSLLPLILFYQI